MEMHLVPHARPVDRNIVLKRYYRRETNFKTNHTLPIAQQYQHHNT